MCVSGDKESKKKQKSPGSSGSGKQEVVMRELKWDHQVRVKMKLVLFSGPFTAEGSRGTKLPNWRAK